MKKIVVGILAHVDAGKTTLSESMLYDTGSIRKMGRVDNKDAFLDTNRMERERGITIFSKQAVFELKDKTVMLLDTPGHIDFSAEMERTLQVLDYAILVISGADGVQGHTRTLWNLLQKYQIPVFLFVNKMDQNGTDAAALQKELQEKLDGGCIDFTAEDEVRFEQIAMTEEKLLEQFLADGTLSVEAVREAVEARHVFPVYFGSALKNEGVVEFLDGLSTYTKEKHYPAAFGAKVFKIARDEQGGRLTYVKITGGTLKVKTLLGEEKINQIRLYSGEKYELLQEAEAGSVCALTGLTKTYPGQNFGAEKSVVSPFLEPVLTYQICLPPEIDATRMLPKLRELEEEDPQLHIAWNEQLQEIQAQLMGEVQIEILQHMIQERYGIEVSFGAGNIVYKETIGNTVEGVGHFEPLRHYAEVHLLLEPLPRGSGIVIDSCCSEDQLDKNWQRLILTHLAEKEHHGILMGAPITDIHITLAAGRAHQKHTEGGDFRQATYRAVRQGLMRAEPVVLEPWYRFRLELPSGQVGRAMTDIEQFQGTLEPPQVEAEETILTGTAPVAAMCDYPMEVLRYTKGLGKLSLVPDGYRPCHNTSEVLEQNPYEPVRDLENTPDSVFCAHGAGFVVPWDQVPDYMHIESVLSKKKTEFTQKTTHTDYMPEKWMDSEEVDRILAQATHANQKEKDPRAWKHHKKRVEDYFDPAVAKAVRENTKRRLQEEYLLVDGYNIIFAWPQLCELAQMNIDAARDKLQDILCNYQAMKQCHLILVFDAYRVQGHRTEISPYHNIQIVYTKEAETADQFIEKFAHTHGRKYRVTVATSDGLEQIIIRGQGCLLLSAQELLEEVKHMEETVRESYLQQQPEQKQRFLDAMSGQSAEALQQFEEKKDKSDM